MQTHIIQLVVINSIHPTNNISATLYTICYIHGYEMNMILWAWIDGNFYYLGCMNSGEVKWTLTINNPYLWTMNNGKFSPAWIDGLHPQCISLWSRHTRMFWIDKSTDHRIMISCMQPWAHWAILYFWVVGGSTSIYLYLCMCVCLFALLYEMEFFCVNKWWSWSWWWWW